MKKGQEKSSSREPLEQMTFEGQWEYACPYCGNLLKLREVEELRCATCGQPLKYPEVKGDYHGNAYN